MNQPEELDFVHTFVPGHSTRTLLLLDGTGGNENDLIMLGRQLDRDANLLIPRGKVPARTHQLADFIEQASVKYRLIRHNLFAVGYSNGANIAGSLLLLRPQTLAGAILLGPMVPIVPEQLPDLSGVPVPAGSGRYDPAGAEVHGSRENAGHGLSGAIVEIVRRWLENLRSGRQYLRGAQQVLRRFGRLSVVLRRENLRAKPQAVRSSRRSSEIVPSNFGKSLPDDDGHVLAPPFVGIWSLPYYLSAFWRENRRTAASRAVKYPVR